jgi:hypothetical protein
MASGGATPHFQRCDVVDQHRVAFKMNAFKNILPNRLVRYKLNMFNI